MTDRSFGFSRATIWKIESGQRPVKVSEMVALADCLEVMSAMSLTSEPSTARHDVQMEKAHHKAYGAYKRLKEAAAAYIDAQLEVLVAAYEAHEDGVAVTELHTTYLDVPAEQAVIEARIEGDHEDARGQEISDAVYKVLAALRTAGYETSLRIEDVSHEGGGPLPIWTPGQSDGTR